MVLRESVILVLAGTVIGIPAAIACSQLVRSRLFGLGSSDPLTLGGASLILMLVALCAALLPAWRASRIDPIRALRYE